ncbi:MULTISPECIES: response regulator [Jeotgalicoccus]|jgi:Response regulator containing a CheY-like receiver domain and an HTH DNA-binding domain|uniref:Response regulator transcription factor n=1 Tax=Jeotgalicoccus nanhaiensis TaxID=568603 RepID=A0ABR9XZE6_9STAP|nr:response regulator transcription factor [Jeotgalicoccus nanhaiensis]MBF0754366.1 response regulator transcription factor [Jeotgalicoccus nanhaiensis]TFU61288.1 response regulator transcription factor [Jeotgalicoccus nanhaiensis]
MKIVIVDDDPLVVSALTTIVENSDYEVAAEGTSGFDAVKLYSEHRPDLLMTDIRMREKSGLEASREILAADSEAKILLITTFKDDEYIHEALNIGCKGYLLKDNLSGIIPAIEAVLSGNMVFDSNIVKSMSAQSAHKDFTDLSTREQDIIELVAEGFNNKEIAEALYLSEGTVRNYISQMLTKLDLRDRTQLAVYYYKN